MIEPPPGPIRDEPSAGRASVAWPSIAASSSHALGTSDSGIASPTGTPSIRSRSRSP